MPLVRTEIRVYGVYMFLHKATTLSHSTTTVRVPLANPRSAGYAMGRSRTTGECPEAIARRLYSTAVERYEFVSGYGMAADD